MGLLGKIIVSAVIALVLLFIIPGEYQPLGLIPGLQSNLIGNVLVQFFLGWILIPFFNGLVMFIVILVLMVVFT